MDKNILYEIINSKSESLTAAEIECIMDEELDKSPEEMDTDLIELCLDALTKADEEKLNSRSHRIRLSRVLLVAVIFILVLGMAVPACAKVFHMEVPEGVARIYKDYLYVDISNDKYITDINYQLEMDGIINPILPNIIYNSSTKVYDYGFKNSNLSDYINFSFSSNELIGTVSIIKHPNNDDVFDTNTVSSNFENVKYFDGNNCKGIILVNEDSSSIQYIDNNINYNIILESGDYETALEIAESL